MKFGISGAALAAVALGSYNGIKDDKAYADIISTGPLIVDNDGDVTLLRGYAYTVFNYMDRKRATPNEYMIGFSIESDARFDSTKATRAIIMLPEQYPKVEPEFDEDGEEIPFDESQYTLQSTVIDWTVTYGDDGDASANISYFLTETVQDDISEAADLIAEADGAGSGDGSWSYDNSIDLLDEDALIEVETSWLDFKWFDFHKDEAFVMAAMEASEIDYFAAEAGQGYVAKMVLLQPDTEEVISEVKDVEMYFMDRSEWDAGEDLTYFGSINDILLGGATMWLGFVAYTIYAVTLKIGEIAAP